MPEFALFSYVAIMCITPGPNNIMLAASGVNFGFRRTLPHLLGISFGSAFQVFLVSNVLAWVLTGLQILRMPLAVVACTYLLYLSWRLAYAAQGKRKVSARPLDFMGAAWFQWINPKAWVMVINAAILFMPKVSGSVMFAAAIIAVVFIVVGFPCISMWAWLGERLRRYLADERALQRFNGVMGGLMALTALYLLGDELQYYWLALPA